MVKNHKVVCSLQNIVMHNRKNGVAIHVLFCKFSKLQGSEVALDALCVLKNAWPSILAESGKAQAILVVEFIHILQLLIHFGPTHL